MKLIVQIFLSIITFLLIMLMFLTFYFIVQKQKGNVPYILGYSAFIATGSSMHPYINEGDFLIIKKANQYKVNDIISYLNYDNIVVTHRIIKENKDKTFVTRGDNNNFNDGKNVKRENIYGKVIYIISGFGVLLSFVLNYKYYILGGLFLLLTIITILMLRRKNNVCKRNN